MKRKKWSFINDSPDQGHDGTTSAKGNRKRGRTIFGPVASSSSPSTSAVQWKYDVFLSFRGSDTRRSITFELYDRLQNQRGIKTFMDDSELEVGDAISSTLLKAIEDSRFAIVVLSPDYAHSTWCLKELTKICECMEDNNRILPLFYNVEPSDVRYRKRSFGDAFDKHQSSGRHRSEKVQQWIDALKKVASFSGWHTKNFKTDRELAETIVDFVCRKVQPIEIGFTISTRDFEAFKATRKAMRKVMKALKRDEVTAVGVYGTGGVGKTTMVKHIGSQACKNGMFDHAIMAVVSQSPDFVKIQHTLAGQLGCQLQEKIEERRASKLYQEIMRKNNVLIILDDIWDSVDLSRIGIPIHDKLKKCNSKVLLTTRRLHVCHLMESQASIRLNSLSEKDSWKLFARNSRRSFESTNFEDVPRRVARACWGLPIALKAVARALGDRDLVEWEKAVRRLEKYQSATLVDEPDAFECIKLSYDYLKDEDSKSCFLLCCLFPEDYDIPVEYLFKYALGKGLFRDTETIYEARGIADSVVKYLKDSSLLLDSEENGCVRMHDVIRDTALTIANSEDGLGFLVKAGCGLDIWPRGLQEGCTAISLIRNGIRELPEGLICPKLQILLLQENADLNEIPEQSVQSLNDLQVLDLSNTSISVLSKPISALTHLQGLYLDFCKKIVDISIIGELKTLEILSMREYPLKELSREIGHLTNLRMLDVSGCSPQGGGIVTIPSGVISKLHKLEELYMLNCGFKGWGSKVDRGVEETNIGFDELAGLSNLKILHVCIPDANYIPKNVEAEPNWVYFDIHIGRCTSDGYNRRDTISRSLVLCDTTISNLPDWFVNVVTTKTEKLKYNCCKGLSDIVMEYDHGRFHELKHLTVSGNFLDSYEYLKELMNTTRRVQKGPVFGNLEELHLIHLSYLKELCVGDLPPGSFINLKVLHVYLCVKLGNVSKLLQRLPNLERLYLKFMHKMEYVFGCEGFEPEQSKLREMNLLALPALRSICNGRPPRAMFHSLKSLTIYHCELLQCLFTSDVAQCLFHLKDLFVWRCPLLERVIEAVNNEKTVLPKLQNLVLKELPVLYGASATVDIECPSLEHLTVEDCPQFLFSTSSSLFYESRNQFSFSTSASDCFGSRNRVQFNDRQQYRILLDRCS